MNSIERAQLALEEKYHSGVNLFSIVQRELDNATDSLLDWCVGTTSAIADWLQEEASYNSKNQRKQEMREHLDLELLVIAIAVAVLFPVANRFVFQVAIGKLARWLEPRLLGMDAFQLAICAAELLALAANRGLFTIDKSKQPFEIQRFLDLQDEDRKLIEPESTEEIFGRTLRLPMISKPHKITYNQCPYLSNNVFPTHIIMGHRLKQHQEFIATDALDKLNSIAWHLDSDVLTFEELVYPEKLEEPSRQAWKACFDLVKEGMLQHGAKHFIWRIDNRGRMYPDCVINFQGFQWIRAALSFGKPEHLTEEGARWLAIDIANQFGLDKETWAVRLAWFKKNQSKLESLADQADKPILFRKAVRAWRKHQTGQPTNHIMGLDAISSGIQVMAILSGCKITAKTVGLINTKRREDLYSAVRDELQEQLGIPIERDTVKYPLMTFMYGSQAVPRARLAPLKGLGQNGEQAFYKAIKNKLPGAEMLRDLFLSLHRGDVIEYSWTLPDGFKAIIPVLKTIIKRLEIDELEHSKVSYAQEVVAPKYLGDDRSLAANIIHSVDAFIAREMIRRCQFDMAAIHDCFYAHPNNMSMVIETYREIMAGLSESDLLNQILTEFQHEPIEKFSNDLGKLIRKSQYALS